YPGWLYEVDMGATTVWERWNSVLPDGKISGTGMNSLNHYAYGTISEFLYRYAAGIQPLQPGFKKVRIQPGITSYLTWLDCSYDSAAGKYRVQWDVKADGVIWIRIEIPFDAEAEIVLPDWTTQCKGAGTYEFLCRTDRNYRCIFTENSRLEHLKKNEEVMEIVRQECPALAAMLQSDDREVLSKSLKELSGNAFSGIPVEQLKQAETKILKITG
ncbi:MAG: alpha-L-rhamnosidase C-terminal domain-containing protein, partial [Oliverpabstia sp.]